MTIYQVPVLSQFVWQPPVIDKDLDTPPGGESKGDRYIVASGGADAWSGHDDEIATFNGVDWDFTNEKEGMAVFVLDEHKIYWYVSSWTAILPVNGIAFPADAVPSGDPNTIDGYEEGTWTVACTMSTSGTVVLKEADDGYYTKIGDTVTVVLNMQVDSSDTPVGTVRLSLPFTSLRAVTGSFSTYNIDWVSGTSLILFTDAGQMFMALQIAGDNAVLADVIPTPNGYFLCQMNYLI